MWCLIMALVAVPRAHGSEDVNGLEEALSEIQSRFPSDLVSDRVYKAALQGVAGHLGEIMGVDDNRVYSESEYAAHMAWMQGRRKGFGADFSILSGRGLLITTVFEDGPAAKGGLKEGDLVTAMNGNAFSGLGKEVIHRLVHRAQQVDTTFDVRRRDGSEHRMTVQRGRYDLPPIRRSHVDGSTPVARIPFFAEGTADALKEYLASVGGASDVVIDLRDNEGGALSEAVLAADLFLEVGAVILHKGLEQAEMEPIAANDLPSWPGGVVVLVNRGTEGAAEAFAAALSDNGRATLVGTRTGGRSVYSSVYSGGRGFVLKIADTLLSSPSGSSWGEKGVVPNVVVEAGGFTVPVGPVGFLDLQRETAIRLISVGSTN